MRYWLLRRPPHYTEINPSATGTSREYDKVSVNVRLKAGNIVYLLAAYGELYGWGHVIKRESYFDEELKRKAYKVDVHRVIVLQNPISADEIKRNPELVEIFPNSDLTLIELTVSQVNSFNQLLRSKGVVAPPDLDPDEAEVKPVPHYNFPRIHLSSEARLWIEAVYSKLRAGKKIVPAEMLVELWENLPEGFDYHTIDKRLLRSGIEPTLLGILHVEPTTELADETHQVILFIKDLIRKEPTITKVTAEQVSEGLTLPEERVGLIFDLLRDLGRFWNGGSGHADSPGLNSINIDYEEVKREYLSYKGIETLLEKFYKERAPKEEKQSQLSAEIEPEATSEAIKLLETHPMDIFISHSSQDEKIAKALIELLMIALNIPADRIRCTSVKGHQLEPGASVEETLRREINESKAFIGLITPSSLHSTYVLFELGARWGIQRHLVPVLALGIDASELKDPLKNRNAVRCDVSEQVSDLIDNIASVLNVSPGRKSSYQRYIDALVRRSKVKKKRAAPRNKTAVEEISALPQSQERSELSSAEQELLIAAADKGDIIKSSFDQGTMIRAGSRTFYDQSDPAVAARYIEALEALCNRGLAKYDEGDLYVLTSGGFRIARELKNQERSQ